MKAAVNHTHPRCDYGFYEMSMPDKNGNPFRRSVDRLFAPLLAGATFRSRLIASVGILLCIAFAGVVSGWLYDHATHSVFMIAPVGASAILLFIVPSSPMAQPWAIIGGNTISALVGVIIFHLVKEPLLASALAVALSVLAMSVTRSMHPPGGAIALTSVIGGHAITDAGFLFPFIPVAVDSALVVLFGLVFHWLLKRPYPHHAPVINQHQTQDIPTQIRGGPTSADIDAALSAMQESFDITREDLEALLRQIEMQAVIRNNAIGKQGPDCASIMSRFVVSVQADDNDDHARQLLLQHNIRSLPVVDADNRLLGTVGLRELLKGVGKVSTLMIAPPTAAPHDPALALLPVLTDGRSHAVIIVNAQNHVVGLISQTDLLAVLARLLPQDVA